MTHQLDADDFFIQRVQQHAAKAGLNFFLIEPLWVDAFLENLVLGKISVRVLLNMHSEHHKPEDVFHRLVRLAAGKGCSIIDHPDVALAAFDKARLHPRLVEHGCSVPYTLILKASELDGRPVAPEERARLGSPFVVKPSMGYGRKGVLLDAQTEEDFSRSLEAWPGEHLLVQEKIIPKVIESTPAYFRVYFVFGKVWSCWWNCYTDHYRRVAEADIDRWNLQPLEATVRLLASMTGMHFFSSEICIDHQGRFVLIDYVNDQCHLLTQTASPHNGVPDDLVADIASALVEGAHAWVRGRQS